MLTLMRDAGLCYFDREHAIHEKDARPYSALRLYIFSIVNVTNY